MTTAAAAAAAADLLESLAPFGPSADGPALALDRPPPAELAAAVRVLHTGVRAALAGRTWWAGGWDRVDPAARLDWPGLFDPDPPRRSGRRPAPPTATSSYPAPRGRSVEG